MNGVQRWATCTLGVAAVYYGGKQLFQFRSWMWLAGILACWMYVWPGPSAEVQSHTTPDLIVVGDYTILSQGIQFWHLQSTYQHDVSVTMGECMLDSVYEGPHLVMLRSVNPVFPSSLTHEVTLDAASWENGTLLGGHGGYDMATEPTIVRYEIVPKAHIGMEEYYYVKWCRFGATMQDVLSGKGVFWQDNFAPGSPGEKRLIRAQADYRDRLEFNRVPPGGWPHANWNYTGEDLDD